MEIIYRRYLRWRDITIHRADRRWFPVLGLMKQKLSRCYYFRRNIAFLYWGGKRRDIRYRIWIPDITLLSHLTVVYMYSISFPISQGFSVSYFLCWHSNGDTATALLNHLNPQDAPELLMVLLYSTGLLIRIELRLIKSNILYTFFAAKCNYRERERDLYMYAFTLLFLFGFQDVWFITYRSFCILLFFILQHLWSKLIYYLLILLILSVNILKTESYRHRYTIDIYTQIFAINLHYITGRW